MTFGSGPLLAGCAFFLLAPCACDAERGAGGESAAASGSATPGDVAAITVTVVDGAGYRKVIEKHRGKVVLVDFWATWCAPCRKLFPHVVELGRLHAKEGLAVVSMGIDDPENKEAVLEFLRKEGAAFDNLVSQFGTGTRSAEELEMRGDVPLYKLYDRAGKLRCQFSGEPEGLEHGEPFERVDEKVLLLLEER